MFVDQVKIHVLSGHGGSGSCSFLRAKFIPKGGPDGGDGGKAGDVILETDLSLTTLADLRHQQTFRSEDGQKGRGKQMTGRDGKDCVIKVPQGTLIKEFATGDILVDLKEKNQSFVIAKGGKGGRGNMRFKTSTNRAPRQFEEGEPGEEKVLLLELKLLADVGIIGFPNAGKSTLIARISNAKPKIADYPFSTLIPNLGVVQAGESYSFVAADIPGLIEGAHNGKGLGIQFLKHIERTRILVHLLDFSAESERDPVSDHQIIQHELKCFSPDLFLKPQILVASKIDHPEAEARFTVLKERLQELNPRVLAISSVTGKGLSELLYQIKDMLIATAEKEKEAEAKKRFI